MFFFFFKGFSYGTFRLCFFQTVFFPLLLLRSSEVQLIFLAAYDLKHFWKPWALGSLQPTVAVATCRLGIVHGHPEVFSCLIKGLTLEVHYCRVQQRCLPTDFTKKANSTALLEFL